ncbi:hypothetical protein [Teredinibacter purpureus]|uniref:hypothetical protein n=1 Tax=Teredinibacter purpureus TaxID=2731756 RepID=UPI0005F7E7BB|nr:hypothetical protein [Teredinibacter purpureus]
MKTQFVGAAMALFMAGCSAGHGYEGYYKLAKVEPNNGARILSPPTVFTSSVNSDKMLMIGKNYVDVDNIRYAFKKIYSKKIGYSHYLVLVDDNGESYFSLSADGNALIQRTSGYTLRMVRTDG